jgi:D-sedoheptulose 7-phosphate isomerase
MSENFIQNYIAHGNDIRSSLITRSDVIEAVVAALIRAFNNGGKMIIFGNGGSAADAQHIASEFISGYFSGGVPLPAIALTTNSSSLTAIANDSGYENIFVRQLQSLAHKGDVVIGISTSGSSANVVLGLAVAAEMGAVTVIFTGQKTKFKLPPAYVISVPSKESSLVQEAHITAGHLICILVGKAFIKEKKAVSS